MPTIPEAKLIELHLVQLGATSLEFLDEIDGEQVPELLDQYGLPTAANLLRQLFADQAKYYRQCRIIQPDK